jgi:hypothetical protein
LARNLATALPPKADIDRRDRHVRFVPKAETRRIGRYGALAVRSASTKVYQVLAATMQAGAVEAADVRAAE